MTTIKYNNKQIDLSSVVVSVEDLNHEDGVWSACGIQVDVSFSGVNMSYQTSTTLDAGGISSQLAINNESGSFASLHEYLVKENILATDEDGDINEDDTYAVAKLIGEALKVQEMYDDYMEDRGHWERSQSGMDANSEVFVRA